MKILEMAHYLSKYVVGFEGNVSEKIEGGFLIKASGTELINLKEEDLVLCNFNKNQINNFNKKPSIEIDFHFSLLKNDEINYVAHVHPINTLKILCSKNAKEFAEKRLFPDQVIFNKSKSCFVPYGNPSKDISEKIELSLKKFIKENNFFPNLFLLENHGIICIGKNYKECIYIADICEKSAEIYLGAKLNKIIFLSNKDIKKLQNDKNEIYRKEMVK